MKTLHLAVGLLISIAASTVPSAAVAQTSDEEEIRNVQVRQADAWNRHDAAAYAGLFTVDGDVVNVVGWWWKGRSEIESKLTSAFAFVFSQSRMAITDVHVRFLSSDIALAHVSWTMAGAKTPPGIPEPKEGIQLQVLKKSAGKWMIASFQNTSSVPERPFPTGPIAPGATSSPKH
ncbi:MAG: SgcJ/EcaC family oxidoreductase [Gemmatimonadales bacterium]